jgi:hypothetical protein
LVNLSYLTLVDRQVSLTQSTFQIMHHPMRAM